MWPAGKLELRQSIHVHKWNKHIETHCHFIWERVENGLKVLEYINTDDYQAAILTKPAG
jgi:hypothetical protein